jgi:hypothetical protein
VAWLSQILHSMGLRLPHGHRMAVCSRTGRAHPGSRLPAERHPRRAALSSLFALEHAREHGRGRSYSEGEVKDLLAEADARPPQASFRPHRFQASSAVPYNRIAQSFVSPQAQRRRVEIYLSIGSDLIVEQPSQKS